MVSDFAAEWPLVSDTLWDFETRQIRLDGLSVNAASRFGMVIAQPNFAWEMDGQVPDHIAAPNRKPQITAVEKAFQVRAAESQSRGIPVPFVLFPEGAIPIREPDGLECVRDQMAVATGEVVFIAGLEGVTPDELADLVKRFPPSEEIAAPALEGGAFANICVIVVKYAQGSMRWHYQAKLAPSQWEDGRNMASGKRVLYFVAPRLAFVCLICFDQIAARMDETLVKALCRKLCQQGGSFAAALDFVFVPQYNPKPTSSSFAQAANLILNYDDRLLKNDLTSVVAINRAAISQEPGEFGLCGIHYKGGRWQVPDRDIGPRGYALEKMNGVVSAIFRKRTGSIHVCELVPPPFNVGHPGDPRHPLLHVKSYLLPLQCDEPDCPCPEGQDPSAGNYVQCDPIPCKLRDTLLTALPVNDVKNRWAASDRPQSDRLAANYKAVRQRLLTLTCGRAGELLDLLFLARALKKGNPDTWQPERECDAVVELASALSVLSQIGQLEFKTRPYWTAELGGVAAVVVLDGGNEKYCDNLEQEYLKAFEDAYYASDTRKRPVLFVALRSRGHVQSMVKQDDLDIARPRNWALWGTGDTPFKPFRLKAFLCKQDLFEEARRADSVTEFMREKVGDVLWKSVI